MSWVTDNNTGAKKYGKARNPNVTRTVPVQLHEFEVPGLSPPRATQSLQPHNPNRSNILAMGLELGNDGEASNILPKRKIKVTLNHDKKVRARHSSPSSQSATSSSEREQYHGVIPKPQANGCVHEVLNESIQCLLFHQNAST